jgi:hypothetical protein
MLQRQQNDCVVASVARATGKTYTEVKRTCGTTKGGLEIHEVEWLLRQYGQWKRFIIRNECTAKQWSAKHPNVKAVLWITPRTLGTDTGHMVSSVKGSVFDPASGDDDNPLPVIRVYILQELATDSSDSET